MDMLDHINRLIELNGVESAYLQVVQAAELVRMAEANDGEFDGIPVNQYRLQYMTNVAFYRRCCAATGVNPKVSDL